jgi:hypothetical protein
MNHEFNAQLQAQIEEDEGEEIIMNFLVEHKECEKIIVNLLVKQFMVHYGRTYKVDSWQI